MASSAPPRWVFPGLRLEVGKPGHQCGLQELERFNLVREMFQSELPVCDFPVKLILEIGSRGFPGEIFIGPIAKCNRCTRQYVLNARIETGTLRLRYFKGLFDRPKH